jgi:hypothetical protein
MLSLESKHPYVWQVLAGVDSVPSYAEVRGAGRNASSARECAWLAPATLRMTEKLLGLERFRARREATWKEETTLFSTR